MWTKEKAKSNKSRCVDCKKEEINKVEFTDAPDWSGNTIKPITKGTLRYVWNFESSFRVTNLRYSGGVNCKQFYCVYHGRKIINKELLGLKNILKAG